MGLFKRKKKDSDTGKFSNLRVAEITQETENSISIGLEIPEELKGDFDFVAGQYLTVQANIAGSEVRRSYSICSDEEDHIMRIGVKRVKGGLMSNYLPDQLKVGDELQVMKPEGNFTLQDAKGSFVGIVAGSGITPVLSQIRKTTRVGG